MIEMLEHSIGPPVLSLKRYNNFSQQLMAAHTIIYPAPMYIHSTAKKG